MISKEEVQHIAKLARLELTEQETAKMQKDLSSILDYFTVLKRAPRKKTESRAEKHGKKQNVVRKDIVLQRNANLANSLVAAAPDKKDGYIKVKQVL